MRDLTCETEKLYICVGLNCANGLILINQYLRGFHFEKTGQYKTSLNIFSDTDVFCVFLMKMKYDGSLLDAVESVPKGSFVQSA